MCDDKTIIKAVRENPERGFRLLMSAYREPVYWHIRRLVVSHADAQDVAQETFIRVFRSFGQYRGESSFRAWVFRIATNEALRLLGRRENEATLSLDEVSIELVGGIQDRYSDNGDTLAAKLQQAILHLPAKQQLAFNLRYYDDMSYDEISQVTGMTADSAKMNYHLAKERIFRYMNSND